MTSLTPEQMRAADREAERVLAAWKLHNGIAPYTRHPLAVGIALALWGSL